MSFNSSVNIPSTNKFHRITLSHFRHGRCRANFQTKNPHQERINTSI